MAYILADKCVCDDGTVVIGGYYGGTHEKYRGVFHYSGKHGAMKFTTEDEASKRAEQLNKAGYNFIVECI